MPERLLLIDSNSLIYRAFFAIPPLTTTKGELSNAVFGFASILLKAFEMVKPATKPRRSQEVRAHFSDPAKPLPL